MTPFTTVTSPLMSILEANIDTDQIIPARFLKVTERAGLGDHLFEDLRRNTDGSLRAEFPLNAGGNAVFLLAGDNFGCGSSREHAVWALTGHGFRAVVSTSFADIFFSNALNNGLLPVRVTPEAHRVLVAAGRSGLSITIDLTRRMVSWPGGKTEFPIDPFAARCLHEGVDPLGYILSFEKQIAVYEAAALKGVNP